MRPTVSVAVAVVFRTSQATKEGLGMDWYVSKQGIRQGPYTNAQIRALLDEGGLDANQLGWRFGLAGWTPLGKIEELRNADSLLSDGEQYKPTRCGRVMARFRNKNSEKPRRGSYCGRHWRGELSLPRSFWINGHVTSLTLVALVVAMSSTGIVDRAPRWFSAGGVAFWLLLALMTPWQLVGVWRSAGNYLARGQSKGWGRLAQAIVILSFFASIFSLANVGLPQSMEFAKLALGRDPVGSYELKLLRDATEFEISGAIVFGLTDKVAEMLDANPKVKIIHLNSSGGRVREARRLRDLIASRNLTTFTSSGCFSACTLAYAAGKRRLIGKNASLGFHQYAFPGMHQSAFRHQHQKDKKDWLARGFDRGFVERAYATPPDDLWRPPHHELFGARFVTGYPGSNEVAMSGEQYKQFAKLESELSKDALFTALREHEPAVYRRVMAELEAGVRDGRNQAEMRKILQPIAQ
ncbi:MAG: GYF domain-containing protein, partial [Deltaproteobacteria bacterium]|nr:GYF domain-containing protein [Deltaproteobacteria bacterium]